MAIAAPKIVAYGEKWGALFEKRWLLWVFVFAVLGAVAANQLGWVAAEVGRQPWIVHPPIARDAAGQPETDRDGYIRYDTAEVVMPDGSLRTTAAGLRTTDAVSEVVTSQQVLASILLFSLIYLLLGALWVFVLNNKIQHGPEPPPGEQRDGSQGLLDAASALAGGSRSLTRTEEA